MIEKLSEKLDGIYTEEGLQWAETYPMVMEAAKEILGESVAGKYLEKESWWWNEEVQTAVTEKRDAWKEWKRASEDNKEEARERYTSLNKTSKEKVAIAKEAASENLYSEIERNYRRSSTA